MYRRFKSDFCSFLQNSLVGKAIQQKRALFSLRENGVYRGVAQMVERLIWDQEAAGSSPVTPTRVEFVGIAATLTLNLHFIGP